MTAPAGMLIADFHQSKPRARLIVTTLALIVSVILLLVVGALVLSAPASAASLLLILPAILVIVFLIALVNASKPARKLQIYADGFILRELKSEALLEQALWTEVNDITVFDRKEALRAGAESGSSQLVGIAVQLADSTASRSGGTPDRDLFIQLPQKKIRLDNSYSNPTPPDDVLLKVTHDVWLDHALQALDAGQTVGFGNVELSPAGVRSGQATAPWSAITQANYLDEAGIVGIWWIDPTQKSPQIMRVPLGYRGEVLIQTINRKIGKTTASLGSRLGVL